MNMSEQKSIEQKYTEVKTRIDSMGDDELIQYLENIHMSDVYLILRDMISPHRRKGLMTTHKVKLKSLEDKSKASWDEDHRAALIKDVNRGCTNVYQILLILIRQLNDDQTRIKDAIDEIRMKLELPVIDWTGDTKGDDNKLSEGDVSDAGDEQGVQENIPNAQ